jgi:menaquinone-specific isochorismate synthase
MITTTPEPGTHWRARSVPQADDVRTLLQSGSLFAWSEDRWIIGWGMPEKSARPDPIRPSFYTPDFFLSDPAPWRVYPQNAAVSPDGLAQMLPATDTGRSWQSFDETAYGRTFAAVQDALASGTLQKAVPAVFDTSEGALTADERARSLRALANLPAGLMPYGCWEEEGGLLGASPELLFEDDSVEIHTMAVAGTARAGAAPDEMMDDPKERAEHRVVLDDLTAQLGPLGALHHGATRPWRIGILSHLRTDLRLTPVRPVPFDELVRLLHPTPAVGIAPRHDWAAWIRHLDLAPRGRFAAPFGLLLPGDGARCLVAIRQVQWDRQSTRCGAGCGLVAGSRLARETAELRLKLSATRGNLGV